MPRSVIEIQENNLEKSNLNPLLLEDKKLQIKSQQNIGQVFDEVEHFKKIPKSKAVNNKIVPIDVDYAPRPKILKKKCPSAEELKYEEKKPSMSPSLLKLITQNNSMRNIKRKRKSFIDNLLNPDHLCKCDAQSRRVSLDKNQFESSILSMIKTAKLKKSKTERNRGEFKGIKEPCMLHNVQKIEYENQDLDEDNPESLIPVIQGDKVISSYRELLHNKHYFVPIIAPVKEKSPYEHTNNTSKSLTPEEKLAMETHKNLDPNMIAKFEVSDKAAPKTPVKEKVIVESFGESQSDSLDMPEVEEENEQSSSWLDQSQHSRLNFDEMIREFKSIDNEDSKVEDFHSLY